MVRTGFRRTRSKSGLPARPDRVLGHFSLEVSAFILRAPQTTMSAKVSPEEGSPSTRPEMRHLLRHKISLWATSYCMAQQAVRLILTEWPANGSRYGTPVRWLSSKELAIMDASTWRGGFGE